MQPVIRFENVGKLYRLGTVGTGILPPSNFFNIKNRGNVYICIM